MDYEASPEHNNLEINNVHMSSDYLIIPEESEHNNLEINNVHMSSDYLIIPEE